MNVSDFDYELPQELIAQTPSAQRDMSRLLVLHKQTGELEHKRFHDIIDFLKEGDCLVLNDSKVLPARIFGEKIPTGAKIEFVLLKCIEGDVWEVILRPGRKALPGAKFSFGGGKLVAEILEVVDDGNRIVKFTYDGNFYELLDEIGNMPLPPYIKDRLEDGSRYQTVYARELGSAAAPTAGLHFTPELLAKIAEKKIDVVYVTLHIGLGTFRPVKVDKVEEHKMHTEFYSITEQAAQTINKAAEQGRRIICVGTTSCRTLESASDESGKITKLSGNTDIFIYPGYRFKMCKAMITNFHLPQSTLIMLVSALAGKENIMNAYGEAIKERYRFFSFGDAMFIE